MHMTIAHTGKGEKMEWIVEAETIEDIVDGQMVICEEIVRCRDCEYIGPLSPTDDYNTCKHKRAMVYAPVDGFCCWGERRTDETIRE